MQLCLITTLIITTTAYVAFCSKFTDSHDMSNFGTGHKGKKASW